MRFRVYINILVEHHTILITAGRQGDNLFITQKFLNKQLTALADAIQLMPEDKVNSLCILLQNRRVFLKLG